MFMNANLFEPGKSKPERNFIQTAVKQNARFDGRQRSDFRDVQLTFGAEWGTVMVTMGDTKVLGQVSCDIGTPSAARPNEGTLHLNVSLGGVAFLDEVQSTHDQRFLTLNSLMERTFRTSRSLDLESLCVAAELHVWCVRVDINVLNHDGNLFDASTVAALAALMHFRRPEVTFMDEQLRFYTEKEREFIPLLFLHYPVSVTYCVYKSSTQPYVDPTLLEENAADSVIVLSLNSYRELCTLNAGGTAPTNVATIMQCARNAAQRAKSLVDFIRKALLEDMEQRPKAKGLVSLLGEGQTLSYRKLMGHEPEIESKQSQALPELVEQQQQPPEEELKEEQNKIEKEPSPPQDDSKWLPTEEQPEVNSVPLKIGKTKPNRAGKTPKSQKKQQQQQSKKNQSDSEEEAKMII